MLILSGQVEMQCKVSPVHIPIHSNIFMHTCSSSSVSHILFSSKHEACNHLLWRSCGLVATISWSWFDCEVVAVGAGLCCSPRYHQTWCQHLASGSAPQGAISSAIGAMQHFDEVLTRLRCATIAKIHGTTVKVCAKREIAPK